MSSDLASLRGLLRLALPEQIGPHPVVQELGRGAMGSVYLVKQGVPDRLVALKRLSLPNDLTDSERDEALKRFSYEVEAAGNLRHDNIVSVYDGTGLRHSPPYFLMQFIDGGTLADDCWRTTFASPGAAARLIATVARAVHYGHQHGVLHRDLKPTNILIDAQRKRPYVTDFGIAQPLGEPNTFSTEADRTLRARTGTPGYMAPELLGEEPGQPTVSSDVYALGVLLYELIVGRRPEQGEHESGFSATVEHHLRQARCPKEIATVCRLALCPDPANRYPSAINLAVDLERAVRSRPLLFAPPTLARRFRLWAKRHPASALGVASCGSIVSVVALTSVDTFRQLSVSRRLAAEQQATEATFLATRIGNELELASRRLVRFANDADVRGVLASPPPQPIDGNLAPRPQGAEDFGEGTTLTLFNHTGRIIARWTNLAKAESSYFEEDFTWRDYYHTPLLLLDAGASPQAERVYLARPFHSHADKLFKFALSTVVVTEGEPTGLVLMTVPSGSTLEAVQMAGSPNLVSALLAPWDRGGPTEPERERNAPLSVVLHASLTPGQTERHSASVSQDIPRLFPSVAAQFEAWRAPPTARQATYSDLIPGFEGERMTAFARVGVSPYMVAVQHPHKDVEREHTLRQRLLHAFGFGGTAALLCVILLIWSSSRSNDP